MVGLLFVEVPYPSNERRVVVLPRPLDRFALHLEGGEDVVPGSQTSWSRIMRASE